MATDSNLDENDRGEPKSFVLSLDVGSTTIRAHVYDQRANICGTASDKIQLLHPQPGWSEMDENVLWEQVLTVIRSAIADAKLTANGISCMGITTQRNTFITWHKDTGVPFHHFITWQDLRAVNYVKHWNSSYTMRMLNGVSKLLYLCSRKKRFLSASVLRFGSAQVTMRLLYEIDHNTELRNRLAEKMVMFGTLDTWLLWKLTSVYATDYSCASTTAIFDPFQMEWSSIVSRIVGIPLHIFPPLRDTSGHFGRCLPNLFGEAIPVTALAADQQAAMFGQCCFSVGDVKITMGTGTFIDCNTGNKPHASIAGLYPLIGWKIGDELVYLAEGHASNTGQCIEWAKTLGLFKDLSALSDVAFSVEDSGGVYFVPAFSGLQAPFNDDNACACLIAINPETSKAHMIRAILESLAHRVKYLYDTVLDETKVVLTSTSIRCDGGVTNNRFIMEQTSTLLGCTLVRSAEADMTTLGAAFLAGLGAGVWKSREELQSLHRPGTTFTPAPSDHERVLANCKEWNRAVQRSLAWYKST